MKKVVILLTLIIGLAATVSAAVNPDSLKVVAANKGLSCISTFEKVLKSRNMSDLVDGVRFGQEALTLIGILRINYPDLLPSDEDMGMVVDGLSVICDREAKSLINSPAEYNGTRGANFLTFLKIIQIKIEKMVDSKK